MPGYAPSAAYRRSLKASRMSDPKILSVYLREYWATVSIKAKSGTIIKSVSDGRAGDGHTHCRAIHMGKKIVAWLEDCAGYTTVVLCKTAERKTDEGEPRYHICERAGKWVSAINGWSHQFRQFPKAVAFLQSQF